MKKKKGFQEVMSVCNFPPELCLGIQGKFINKKIAYFIAPIGESPIRLKSSLWVTATVPYKKSFIAQNFNKERLINRLTAEFINDSTLSKAGLVYIFGYSEIPDSPDITYIPLNDKSLSWLETEIIDGGTGKLIRHLFENNLKKFQFPDCLPCLFTTDLQNSPVEILVL